MNDNLKRCILSALLKDDRSYSGINLMHLNGLLQVINHINSLTNPSESSLSTASSSTSYSSSYIHSIHYSLLNPFIDSDMLQRRPFS